MVRSIYLFNQIYPKMNISVCNPYKNIKEILYFLFCTKSLKSGVYFILTAPLIWTCHFSSTQ